jgi:hypothetical protein
MRNKNSKKITLETLTKKIDSYFSITLETMKTTIEELAVSTQNGFVELEKEMKTEFAKVNVRLDILEGSRYHAHETRIENLEDSMRKVKRKLDLK